MISKRPTLVFSYYYLKYRLDKFEKSLAIEYIKASAYNQPSTDFQAKKVLSVIFQLQLDTNWLTSALLIYASSLFGATSQFLNGTL